MQGEEDDEHEDAEAGHGEPLEHDEVVVGDRFAERTGLASDEARVVVLYPALYVGVVVGDLYAVGEYDHRSCQEDHHEDDDPYVHEEVGQELLETYRFHDDPHHEGDEGGASHEQGDPTRHEPEHYLPYLVILGRYEAAGALASAIREWERVYSLGPRSLESHPTGRGYHHHHDERDEPSDDMIRHDPRPRRTTLVDLVGERPDVHLSSS